MNSGIFIANQTKLLNDVKAIQQETTTALDNASSGMFTSRADGIEYIKLTNGHAVNKQLIQNKAWKGCHSAQLKCTDLDCIFVASIRRNANDEFYFCPNDKEVLNQFSHCKLVNSAVVACNGQPYKMSKKELVNYSNIIPTFHAHRSELNKKNMVNF